MNFDLALFSSKYNTVCLIECKSNLTKGLKSASNELQRKIDLVENNDWIDLGGRRIKVRDYFEEALGITEPNFYYVLASEIVDLGTVFDKGSVFESIVTATKYPFDIWRCQLVFPGIKLTRNPIPANDDREKKVSIASLTSYLEKVHAPAGGNSIQICLSSNKYYLAVQACMTLKRFDSFCFSDFLDSFCIDLKDYEEFEKRYLFDQFIRFGKECGFLKILHNGEDTYTSSYAVINRRMKPQQLKNDIISKIAARQVETDPGLRKRIEEEEEIILKDIQSEKLKREKQTTLEGFTE